MDKKYIYWIITGAALVTTSLVFEWFVPNMLAQRQADLLQQRAHKLTTLYSQQLPAWSEWSNIVSTILIEETVEKTVEETVREKHETGVETSALTSISAEHFNAHIAKLINAFPSLVRVSEYSDSGDIIATHTREESMYTTAFAENVWLSFESKSAPETRSNKGIPNAVFSFETTLSGPVHPYLPLLNFAFRHPYNETVWLILSFDITKILEQVIDQATTTDQIFVLDHHGDFITHSEASLRFTHRAFAPTKFADIYSVNAVYSSPLLLAKYKGLVKRKEHTSALIAIQSLTLADTEQSFSVGLLRDESVFSRELLSYRLGFYSLAISLLMVVVLANEFMRRTHRERRRSNYQKSLNKALFDASLDGIVTVAEDFSVIAANASAEHLLGFSYHASRQLSLAVLFAQSTKVSFIDLLAQYKEGLLLNVTELVWTRQDKRKLRLLCTLKSIQHAEGEKAHYVFIFKDVTQERDTIAALVKTVRELKEEKRT